MSDTETTVRASGSGLARPVPVLAARLEDYAPGLALPGLAPVHVSSVAGLLQLLARQAVSGFVLELDTVLRATAMERGYLFQLAEAFPLLRVRGARPGGSVAFLDDPADFAARVRGFEPRPARHAPRLPVLLHALVARPGAVGREAFPATILDLSASGGALCCAGSFEPGEELALSIQDLRDPAPMQALACWSGLRGRGRPRRHLGVRFLDMRPGQASELEQRLLGGLLSGTS